MVYNIEDLSAKSFHFALNFYLIQKNIDFFKISWYNIPVAREIWRRLFPTPTERRCCYGRNNSFYFVGNDNYNLHKEITAYSAK